jgi:beta-phosphoglucomutase-like phosphatase (HAD superfamily)
MTPDQALDAVIRDARHLLFAFNGLIRSASAVDPGDPTTPTAPYIHEAFAACNESGRSVVVISTKPKIDVPAYLAAHDLFTPITVIAASVADAINFLGANPAECLLITSSTAEVQAAQAAGTPSIGYARTPDDAAHVVHTGAIASVYSMADLVLALRSRPLSR